MPARLNSPPPPETVAFVRRRYAANVPVADILAESDLSIGALYQCVDGRHDDGSGLPVPPLPRRTTILRRRPPVRNVRAALDGDAAKPAPQSTIAPATGDNDPVPRDLDEFRRRLAEKIDKLAAADAAEGAGGGAA